jgi:hypothetical protein
VGSFEYLTSAATRCDIADTRLRGTVGASAASSVSALHTVCDGVHARSRVRVSVPARFLHGIMCPHACLIEVQARPVCTEMGAWKGVSARGRGSKWLGGSGLVGWGVMGGWRGWSTQPEGGMATHCPPESVHSFKRVRVACGRPWRAKSDGAQSWRWRTTQRHGAKSPARGWAGPGTFVHDAACMRCVCVGLQLFGAQPAKSA